MHRLVPFLLPGSCLLLVLALAPAPSDAVPQPATDAVDSLTASESASSASSPAPEDDSGPLLTPPILLTGYCALVVAGSLFGGWLPSLISLTHTRMQTIVSFVGGLMLGISVFHLIPHASHQLRDMDTTMLWMMCGILLMFFLIRTFHFHNHGIAENNLDDDCDPCHQDHAHSHGHLHSHPHAHQFSWVGIVVGLSIHTLLDGIALGSAVKIESLSGALLPGLGVFLAVLLHKPLDAVSITSLMAAGGWEQRRIQAVNAGFAMMCPLGAALLLLGADRFPGVQQELAGAAMAFSAGVFLCIALSDLLPEMEFHSHHRLRLSLALGAGIAVAWAMRLIEPAHIHG